MISIRGIEGASEKVLQEEAILVYRSARISNRMEIERSDFLSGLSIALCAAADTAAYTAA
jgi:hypothetical protein